MLALMALISLTKAMLIKTTSGIQPDKGDKLPPFAKTFPGCGCTWQEPGWSCEGSIAFPEAMVGQPCCCCGGKQACKPDSRCSNEACLTIGVDQKKEIDAEEARLKAILGDADLAIGDLPAYKLKMSARPTGSSILAACKAKNMVPLCDGANYCGSKECYFPNCVPGQETTLPKGTFFSTPMYMLKTDIDPTQFYCAAFYGSYYGGSKSSIPHGGALTAQGMKHMWVNHVTANTVINVADMKTGKTLKSLNCQEHGWHTYCVDRKPTPRR